MDTEVTRRGEENQLWTSTITFPAEYVILTINIIIIVFSISRSLALTPIDTVIESSVLYRLILIFLLISLYFKSIHR